MNKKTDNTTAIHREYLRIVEQLKHASIFGEKVDINNNEIFIVGAYFLGRVEAGNMFYKAKENEINNLLGEK